MKVIYHLLSITLLCIAFGVQSGFAQDADKKQKLKSMANDYEVTWQQEYNEAVQRAKEVGIPVRTEYSNGTVFELQKFENGLPVYLKTYNRDGAESSFTHELYPGGALGLSLTGSTQTLGVWDGGKVRDTHQEFGGRVTQQDGATDLSDHATHVSGTMIASGVDPDARGMAYEGSLDAYDWGNDDSEMANAAANGLLVSNHSYGSVTGWEWNSDEEEWYWYGDTDISETEDYRYGFYGSGAENWDNMVYNAPNYVIVKSAGNDRNDVPASQPVSHFVWSKSQGDWVTSTTVRDPDGDYSSIANKATAKNIITMGAVNSSGGMSTFSGWGPTNDGRIKPDIVAKGVSVYSSLSGSDTEYASYNGTSMSSPVASGSISLLQEHYINLYGQEPLASTIKALVIHTATDLGLDGPDYANGWGMLNTGAAAEVLSNDAAVQELTHVRELTKSSGFEYEEEIWNNGEEPLRVTIAWTDPAGSPVSASVDANDVMLVNDLDLRLVNEEGEEFEPYVRDVAGPDEPFLRGDNDRDNVEQVYIDAPEKGYYTIKVSNKGTLTNSSQDYSLIVTGNMNPLQEATPAYLTLSQDGQEGYAYATSSTSTDISGNTITIEMWVKMDASSDPDAILVSKKGSDAGSNGYELATVGDGEERRIIFAPSSYSSRHIVSNTGIRAGEWTHISAVYNDGDAFLYINGELDAQETNSSRALGSTASNLTIGSNSAHTGNFFRGSIDELRLWGNARSMFDIQGDFDGELNGDESGLMVYYPFNDESAQRTSDYTSFGNTLWFNNIVGTEGPGVFPLTPMVYGKIGNQSVTLKIDERDFAEGVANHYKIYRTGTGVRNHVGDLTTTSGAQLFTDDGISNGNIYKYEVTVVDDEGNEGDFSNPIYLSPNQQIGGTSLTFENQGFVEFTERPNHTITGNHITIEFWVKRDENSSGVQAIVTNESNYGGNGYGVYMVDGGEEARIVFTPSSYSSRHVTSRQGIRANEWTHVAAVYNDGKAQIYINGELDVEKINDSRAMGSADRGLTLGSNTEQNGQFFQGDIDELRIWNKNRTLSEIQSDFNEILWGDEDGLVGYWRFNEKYGGIVYGQAMRAASANGVGAISYDGSGVFPIPPRIYAVPHDGDIRVYVEQPEYAAESVSSYKIYRGRTGFTYALTSTQNSSEQYYLDEDVTAEETYRYKASIVDGSGGESDFTYPVTATVYDGRPAGQALRFEENQSAHVQFEYNPALDISGDSITVEAWVLKDQANQEGAVILSNNIASGGGYGLFVTDAGASSRITFGPTSYGSRHVTTQTYLEPNKWYHIAGVYNDGKARIYVNGALDNSKDNDPRSIGSNDYGLVIGASYLGADHYFIGEIDEVRIWNRTRSNTQIASNYNQSLMGDEAGLVGYWRFDENTGTTTKGSAEKPLHGTLINGPQFVPSAAFEGTPFVPVHAFPADSAVDQQIPLTFEWYPVDNAVSYELEVSPTQSFKQVIFEREITDTLTTLEMGLAYDSTYYWRVRANTNQFTTNWSHPWSFSTELPVPETPVWEPEDGAEDMETQLTLKWSEAERAETYHVQMSTESDFSATLIDSSGISETELEVNDLETSTTYYWRVLATNETGNSSWSEVLEFTTVATSAGELSASVPSDFTLDQNYPNPFNPSTTIRYGIPEGSEVQLVVFDMLGRRVAELVNERQSPGYHQVSFDAGNLASGIYIYRLKAGEYVVTKKMMLAK